MDEFDVVVELGSPEFDLDVALVNEVTVIISGGGGGGDENYFYAIDAAL